MMRLKNWLFPLALAMILGGLSAWLERISDIVVEETKLPAHEPQYLMQQMEGKRFDAAGDLQERLNADRAWQLPDRKSVYFQGVDFQTHQQGKPQYRVTSGQARYDLARREIVFEQGVQLAQHADGKRLAAQVDAPYLWVDTQNQVVRTDAEVAYRYGQSSGSAVGLVYDHKQGKLDFPAKIRALIYHEEH